MKVNLPHLLKEKGIRQAELARKLDLDRATITRWVQHEVPLVRVLQIEEATGITREELRPDFFGPRK